MEIFELKMEQLNKVMPHLSKLFQSKSEEARVELHKGGGVYLTLIKSLLAEMRHGDSVYLMGVDEEVLKKVEPFYPKRYIGIIKKKGVREKIIIAAGKPKLRHRNIEYREIDAKYIDNIITVIHRSKVFICALQEPNYLIIIQNEKIANTYRKQFELLWSATEKS